MATSYKPASGSGSPELQLPRPPLARRRTGRGSEPALGSASSHLPWHGPGARPGQPASQPPWWSGQRDLSLCCPWPGPAGSTRAVGRHRSGLRTWATRGTHCPPAAPTSLLGLGVPLARPSLPALLGPWWGPLCEGDQRSHWSLASSWGLARFCQGGRGPAHLTPLLPSPMPLAGPLSSWEEFQLSSGLSSCPLLRPFPAVLPWGSLSFRPLGGGPAAPAWGRGQGGAPT